LSPHLPSCSSYPPAVSAPQAAETPAAKVVGTLRSPSRTSRAEFEGFDIDVAEEIARRMGVEVASVS
jgi:ABC-type amino acid transport substrate-binding protein